MIIYALGHSEPAVVTHSNARETMKVSHSRLLMADKHEYFITEKGSPCGYEYSSISQWVGHYKLGPPSDQPRFAREPCGQNYQLCFTHKVFVLYFSTKIMDPLFL